MIELERKAVKESLRYNTKYSEDRDLEKALKNPEKFVNSYDYTLGIVKLLRQKAYRDGYNASAKELLKENEQLKKELLTYKNSICNKECAEVWGESERLKEENERLKQQLTKGRDILFDFVKIACETFSEGCPECDYCFLGEVKQKAEVFFKELAE